MAKFWQHAEVGVTIVAGLLLATALFGFVLQGYTTAAQPAPPLVYNTEVETETVSPSPALEPVAVADPLPTPPEPPQPFIPIEGQQMYITVTDGCGPYFGGECLNVRSGPGTDFPTVAQLRTGMVLKVQDKVAGTERDWYHVVFDEWLRYPERLQNEWYVAAEYVEVIYDVGPQAVTAGNPAPTTTKQIVVDRSDQRLYAYEGDALMFEETISTGLALTPTPRGTFTIFRKTPSRYMQGPLPYLVQSKEYDLPGVPWNLYFTEQGAVIHGTYWHDKFGDQYSHGCVNVNPDMARELYAWADLGTTVVVRD